MFFLIPRKRLAGPPGGPSIDVQKMVCELLYDIPLSSIFDILDDNDDTALFQTACFGNQKEFEAVSWAEALQCIDIPLFQNSGLYPFGTFREHRR